MMNENIQMDNNSTAKKKIGKYILCMLVCILPILLFRLFMCSSVFFELFQQSLLMESYEYYEIYSATENIYYVIRTAINILFTVGYLLLMILPLITAIKDKLFDFKESRAQIIFAGIVAVTYGLFSFCSFAIYFVYDMLWYLFFGTYSTFDTVIMSLIGDIIDSLPDISITVGIFFFSLIAFKFISTCKHNKIIKNQNE